MSTSRSSTRSSRSPSRPAVPPSACRHSPLAAPGTVKLVLVDFRSGEAVQRHPDLQPWLEDGWMISSAAPRVVEGGRTKLLVTLERLVAKDEAPHSPSTLRPVES